MRFRRTVITVAFALSVLLTLVPGFALATVPASPPSAPITLTIVSDSQTEVLYNGAWVPAGPAYLLPLPWYVPFMILPCLEFHQLCWPTLPGASRIWTPGGPQKNVPISFSRAFDLPSNAESISGNISITAGNAYSASLGGTAIGDGNNWNTVQTYPMSPIPGRNELQVIATNVGDFDAPSGDAGLLFRADITYTLRAPSPPTAVILSNFGVTSGPGGWPVGAALLAGGLTAGGFALWRRRKLN